MPQTGPTGRSQAGFRAAGEDRGTILPQRSAALHGGQRAAGAEMEPHSGCTARVPLGCIDFRFSGAVGGVQLEQMRASAVSLRACSMATLRGPAMQHGSGSAQLGALPTPLRALERSTQHCAGALGRLMMNSTDGCSAAQVRRGPQPRRQTLLRPHRAGPHDTAHRGTKLSAAPRVSVQTGGCIGPSGMARASRAAGAGGNGGRAGAATRRALAARSAAILPPMPLLGQGSGSRAPNRGSQACCRCRRSRGALAASSQPGAQAAGKAWAAATVALY